MVLQACGPRAWAFTMDRAIPAPKGFTDRHTDASLPWATHQLSMEAPVARPRTRTPDREARTRILVAAAMIAMALAVMGPVHAARGASDRLPDLKMAPLNSFRISVEDGRRLLRFGAMMVNVGTGHFEVRGSRTSTSDPSMSVSQIVYNNGGGSRAVTTNAEARYSGDGHDHWHVQQMMSYSMWPAAGGMSFYRGAKVGFCFLDTNAWDLSIPGARQSSYYREAWCGTQATLSNRVGISLGWGDSYPYTFAFQWIDITNVPAGDYYVKSVVDEPNFFLETSNTNNCTWNRIRIPATGTNVTRLSSGSSCIQPPSSTTFAGMVNYAAPRRITFAAGTHVGYRFASNGAVISTLPATLARASGADAMKRSTIPGQSGTWFYISNGIWSGSWVRESAGVVGGPLPVAHDSFPGTTPVSSARISLAAGAHYGYQFTVDGTTIASKWYPLASASGAAVDRRGTLPGRSGTWSHVANGIWAGYWFRESDRAVFQP